MRPAKLTVVAAMGLALLVAGPVAFAKGKHHKAAAGVKPTGKVHTVHIRQMKFVPPELDAQVGDTVVWKDEDMVPHSATAEDKSFDTGLMPPGESRKVVLQKAGEIPYYCSNHPDMHAKLEVSEPGKDSK